MKTKKFIFSIYAVMGAFAFSLAAISCSEDAIIRGDETDALPYIFRPAVFKSSGVGNTPTVELSWAAVSGAKSYSLEIYNDSLEFNPANFVLRDLVTATSYTVELAGGKKYSARIKANPDNPARDSKWNGTVFFKTPTENVFYGYSSFMSAQGAVTVKWAPAKTVTKLTFTSGTFTRDFTLSAAEITAGSKVCTGLPNANYSIHIYNNTIDRGNTSVLLEGDVFLAPGDDLEAAYAAATPGAVIVLAEGATYPLSTKGAGAAVNNAEGFLFNKDIVIRGMSETNRSLIYPTTAFGTALFDFGATLSNVSFKNLNISGLVGNTGSTVLSYFVNQKNTATITNLNFINCEIHHYAGGMRFQTSTSHYITNLTIDKCIYHDFGTGYGIIHIQAGKADNIKITNTTAYKFDHNFILHNANNSQSLAIENCTFDNIDPTAASIRYLVEYTANYDVLNGISIKNCIFGKSGAYSGGVRTKATTLNVSGSYATSDYKDDTQSGSAAFSLMTKTTAYAGASSALFIDPATGDFHIKDAAFAGKGKAGDPRWY